MESTVSAQISEHFTFKDLLHSDTATAKGIVNSIDLKSLEVAAKTAIRLERVRAILQRPIQVSSWYRCPELNKAVGSGASSQHIKGEAVDFKCPQTASLVDVCNLIVAHADYIEFDQLILEHNWIHISFAILSGKPRKQVLSLLSNGKYAAGLTDPSGKQY